MIKMEKGSIHDYTEVFIQIAFKLHDYTEVFMFEGHILRYFGATNF
jgi:hypothetical protein